MKAYSKKVRMYVQFCKLMQYPAEFATRSIILFCQWYVSGTTAGKKLRAHTTLPKFLSAFRDHAVLAGVDYPDDRGCALIQKAITGIKNRFPHEKVVETPVTLASLAVIARLLGIRKASDLNTISVANLCLWARLITAYAALLRPVAHSLGMQVKDLEIDADGGTWLVVGRHKATRKLKGKQRTVPIPNGRSHLDAGYVLQVLCKKIHTGRDPNACMIPMISPSDEVLNRHQPWSRDLRRFQHYCRRAGIRGAIGGRSLRSGGVVDLFANEATREHVRHQGGWGKGYTFDEYDRPSPAQLGQLAEKYARRIRRNLKTTMRRIAARATAQRGGQRGPQTD